MKREAVRSMPKKSSGLKVIDLFCGAGGFSEGFHQAGFDVVYGVDFWKPACKTHTLNGLGETVGLNLLEIELEGIIALKAELESRFGHIDIVIGSPPCTEFSYAKKGGKGDIEEGMLLVRKHLEFVSVFKPKYWLIENVPRLESVLNDECEGSRESGWKISYEKLGIQRSKFAELGLEGDSLQIPVGRVFTASDYGTCENRKRFIAGDFPIQLMDNQRVSPGTDVSLGRLLRRLSEGIEKAGKKGQVEDPNYQGHSVRADVIRDHYYDTSLHPMYWEEMRFLKRRHIQYGRMNLPEDLSLPARTIMATANSSSRESLILGTDRTTVYHGKKRKVFRQPTVREVSCIQGFPLDFQLAARSLNDRYKLIGNAVPCQLSFALAKSMLDGVRKDSNSFDNGFVERAETSFERLEKNGLRPIVSRPKLIVEEAEDIGKVHLEFRARDKKYIRRKMLSSKLENDSCIVIFENSSVEDGKVHGSTDWKACIQRGMGDTFHRVYLDDVSVPTVLRALSAPLDCEELKRLLRDLVENAKKGVPVLRNGWTEFPGYEQASDSVLALITTRRLRLPGVMLFQKAFTSDMRDLGNTVGPVDFFDGLDALMLSVFKKKQFEGFLKRMVFVSTLKDKGDYSHKLDPRIVSSLMNVDVPLVTLMAGLVSVTVLDEMYKLEKDYIGDGYSKSLDDSSRKIAKWCHTD